MKKLSIAEEFKLKPIEKRSRYGSSVAKGKIKMAKEMKKIKKKLKGLKVLQMPGGHID